MCVLEGGGEGGECENKLKRYSKSRCSFCRAAGRDGVDGVCAWQAQTWNSGGVPLKGKGCGGSGVV